MTGRRNILALTMALTALGWSAVAEADDTGARGNGQTTASASMQGGRGGSYGARPQGDRVGTTHTTAAYYDERAGAERASSGAGPNRFLLVTGAAAFGGSYLTSAIAGVANDRDADKRLLVPVIGPWMNLADRQCDEQPCDSKFLSSALLVTSGLLQAGGAAAIVSSFFIPRDETPQPFGKAAPPPTNTTTVQVTPMAMGRGASGLGLVGRF